ncbi:uncharacterized protein LOC108041032 [Drosophila rhopaloa]|uniref:Uncharacterized protein LOC108041032 n=1 Tax=Drosophila rhopaloa TaxID=1041015 RepID=A0A6P4ECL4_DRORH|nr:uncharacterized protein LOC108041032 [Drosophila rhopaloa]
MKYFVICALAALVLLQASSAFKFNRVIYVVPAPATTAATTVAPSSSPTTAATTTAAPAVVQVVYCSWKNNWCRTNSNTVRNCKWGLCKFNG